MIRKSTFWIGGLAIGLGLWIVGWERHLDSTDQTATKARFLSLWNENAVTRLKIAGPGGELEVERGPEQQWRLMRPVEDEADPEKMNQLVRHLCHLAVVEKLSGNEFSAEEFGFSRSNVIEVDLMSAHGLVGKILLGRDGPFEKTAYASSLGPAGSARAGLVRMEVREWLASPLAQLRDRRLLRLQPGAVTQYRLKTAQGEIAMKRAEREPRWFIETPLQSRANDDIAYSLLEELTKLEAEEFRDDQALTGLASLDGLAATFRLQAGSENPIDIVMRQEEDAEGSGFLLAKRSGRKAVLRIRDDLVKRLPRSVNQLRFPYLAEFPANGVARILLRSQTDPDVVLFFSGKEWKQSYRSEQWPANSARIDELLGALNTEPVLEFRSSSGAQTANFGLDRPILTLSVTTSRFDEEEVKKFQARVAAKGGNPKGETPPKPVVETKTIKFGRGEDAFLNANFEGEPYIFAIDPAFVLSHMPTHPLKWRGLRLLNFRPIDIREVSVIEAGGPETLLSYDPLRNQWRGAVNGGRVDDKINSRLAEGLAYHLGSLTAIDWLTDRRDALRALQRPSCRIRIKISPGTTGAGTEEAQPKEIALCLAPSAQGDRGHFYFGQFEGQPDVFLLNLESYFRLIGPVLKQDL